ncbi:MAG: hypothetical protein H7247_08515 [Polaromonas sp.]|nr:hypothetical protein [Gemmatimonadaceae bacterium]
MGKKLAAPGAVAFEELFPGLTGAPGGTAGMASPATGIVFLRAATEPALLAVLSP